MYMPNSPHNFSRSYALQHAWVIRASKTDVLNLNQINAGLSQANPSNDVVLKFSSASSRITMSLAWLGAPISVRVSRRD